ncbi:MAG: [NiFe]-hydrogenase assembly chaperone HybE [Pseudomonadota bacterium]
MQFYASDPGALVEATFRRILAERMAGLDLLNPALDVAALGFEQVGADWRGVLVTPWGISLLLLPATADWAAPASHERAFRDYPSGTFAFLGNHEDDLGPYLACPLIHDMSQFADQETAVMTARACLIALELAPVQPGEAAPEAPASTARRRFLTLGG